MLISFFLENCLSFRDKTTFTLVASREKQHLERIPHIPQYAMRVLPTAAIYGGNASGKTNFFLAFKYAKDLIVQGTRPEGLINVEPFRLDPEYQLQPTGFAFEIMVDDTCYEFGFRITQEKVVEEWLIEILKTTDKELYRRHEDNITFAPALKKDKLLHFAFQGTRNNQLFLTNAVSQKIERFKGIYDWFRDNLVLIAPDSRFTSFERFFDEQHSLYGDYNQALARLDTGIVRMGGEGVPFENLPIPEELKNKLKEELGVNGTVRIVDHGRDKRFVISRRDNELKAWKLVSFHAGTDRKEIKFETSQESDGTNRVIDLLPAFIELIQPKVSKVYLIDELDRSLHTQLIRNLLETYLASCSPDSRAQLLFTTHDVLLMDQELLRRDEMWVAEREADGSSTLIPFSDYKDVRSDKDIRKSYLQGRLGGIPRLVPKRPDDISEG